MLILTRRIGESVYIGDEVRLTVLGVRGTQVRLGINAPKDIPVHREEIYYKIKHEQSGGGGTDQGNRGEHTNRANRHDDQGNDRGDNHGDDQGDDQVGNRAESASADQDNLTDEDDSQPSAEEADPNNA